MIPPPLQDDGLTAFAFAVSGLHWHYNSKLSEWQENSFLESTKTIYKKGLSML